MSSPAQSQGKPEASNRLLSDEQIEEIFRLDVEPRLARHASQDAPRVVLLGGPQGSRKTTLRSLVAEQLGLEDALIYEGDDHFPLHPHFDGLMREHGLLAAADACKADLDVLQGLFLEEVRAQRLNIMFVGPYTDQEYTLSRLATFREDGYQSDLAYTALHPALTHVGVMDRHRRAVSEGPGDSFLVSVELQQMIYDGVPAIMTVAEDRDLADGLHVVDAAGVAYSKHRGADGHWTPQRPLREVVEEVRHRPWDTDTREDYLARRAAVETPVGESPTAWGARLRHLDSLAAPMLGDGAGPGRVSAQAARRRSTTLPPGAQKKPSPSPRRPGVPPPHAPGASSSSGHGR
ncbi:zeta toxin family protein [Streptomyces albidoflavus]|uniref:zeta toxin family protein n=1 Tax=Streptomyces albidoflavus TaxID=1886 RepID=UPI0033DA7F4A